MGGSENSSTHNNTAFNSKQGNRGKDPEGDFEPESKQGCDPKGTKQDHEVDNEEHDKWAIRSGWTYVGHGEWAPPEEESAGTEQADLDWDPDWVYKWRCTVDEDVRIHQEVLELGYPNRWGARKPIQTRWNLELLEELLEDYEDKDIVEWIRYGWLPSLADPRISKNHKGATDHLEALAKYIHKEQAQGAIMGPYEHIPFLGKVGISPLSTRPKKESQERRVILDLSFPVGQSVNDGIPKDSYLGFSAKLSFPKVDDFAFRIYSIGKGCMMFKVDLSRYFRQLPLDPGDYSLIGYIIDGKVYFDKVLPMGMRSAPYIAQRVTNAIAYIHRRLHYFILNYMDDFVAAEVKENIWAAYHALTDLLNKLRVDISEEKLVPPTTRLEFLRITFDSNTMTMEISEDKMKDIQQEIAGWLLRTKARRKEVESLIGKLQFMAKCVKAGRIFLSRLIQWIRGMDRKQEYSVLLEARKDIAWWGRCAQEYNGISLVWLHKEPEVDRVITTDTCLTGYGGTMKGSYFRGRFPNHIRGKNIAILEILAVMVGLKVWGHQLTGQYFWVHVDNEAVATVINTGASRDTELQKALREIALIAAKHQFVIKARHISGISNRIPDWLSRWQEPQARKAFRQHVRDSSLR